MKPEQTARLTQLEARRSSSRSSAAAAQSLALEKEALAAQQAGQSAGSIDKLREALRLQREANAAGADAQNIPREVLLAQTIELIETEPLHAAVESALALAHAAVAQEHWDEALKAYTEARTAQLEINQKHSTTRYANFAGIDGIDGEIASLQAAGLVAIIALREREGDAAMAAQRSPEAAASYAAAAELQRQVNERFPRSRFMSAAHTDELNAKRDTVLAAPLMARAAALDDEITVALVRRDTLVAREKIGEAARLIGKATTDFPRSRSLDRALQFKLNYLALRRRDLDALHGELSALLATLPGAKETRMLKTEVSQDLYSRVMNVNPSRNPERALPVDSVNWTEAQDFCQRLSWLLGARVRLPREEEMRVVFAETNAAWSAETSGGHSHETGKSAGTAAGFHDVAGNLAEWLQPPTESDETAPVAGGSYLDPASALATFTVTPTEKHERARHLGFRVVVEAMKR